MDVTNITSTFNLDCIVSHALLKNKLTNFELKKNFMVVRIRNPRATALIFESGSVSMSGLNSIVDVRKAARRIGRKVQQAGFPDVRIRNLVIQNIAFSLKLPYRLQLEKLQDKLDNLVIYAPELYSGATVHGTGSKRFIYFRTGSVVVTGYKNINEARADYNCIVKVAELIKYESCRPS